MVLSTQVRGVGRPLVLLPWFGVDHAFMAAAFEPGFAGTTGLSRIYIDLPGTGDSPPVEPHSDAVLDAVEKTIESMIGTAPFLLAGCSYGGYLAAGLARRTPTQIAGLLLVCPGVKIRPEQRNLSRVLPATAQPRWLAEVPDELHEHFGHAIGNQTRSVANRIALAFQRNGPTNEGYLAALRSTGYQLSDESSTQRFHGNVTIIAGRADRIAGHLDQFDALDHYPHGSFVVLGDAGHYLPFEQPERFRALTLAWLAQNDTASPQDPNVGPRNEPAGTAALRNE